MNELNIALVRSTIMSQVVSTFISVYAPTIWITTRYSGGHLGLFDESVQLLGLRKMRVQPKRFLGFAPGIDQAAGAGSRGGKPEMGTDKIGAQRDGLPEVGLGQDRLAQLHGQFAKGN